MENCYERALHLLARSEHSRKGLERKLLLRGFTLEAITQALDKLEEEGALSDVRYAEEWVRSRLRKHPEGQGLLILGLEKRGVSRDLASGVVKKFSQGSEYRTALQSVYHSLCMRGVKERDALTAALRRKGFTPFEIRAFLEEFS
jgi:regulatory protein